MKKSESIDKLASALAKAQAEMGGALTDASNPFFKSKYADLGSIIKVIKPPFAKHGLSYSQFPITEDDRIGVETVIMHSSGQFISQEYTMKVPKADPQSAGGVISYCRRYALQAVCGIPAVDSDAEEYMQVDREEDNKPSSDDQKEERKAVKEGAIKQTNDQNLKKALATKWEGKKKHTGDTLGAIAKKDPGYLIGVLKNSYEILKENNPALLKAVEIVVKDIESNGKQDFAEAA